MSIRSVRRPAALVAVAFAALLTVTACGSASNYFLAKNPDVGPGSDKCSCGPAGMVIPQQAENGVTSLLDQSALTATATLDADPATLAAVFGADKDSPVSAAQAGRLAGATAVLAARTDGGSFRSLAGSTSLPADAAFSLAVSTRTTPNLVQFVVAGQTLYARADVQSLLSLLGGGGAPISRLLHSPNLPAPLAKAVAGQWVSIDLAGLTGRDHIAGPSVGPSQAAGLAGSLDALFRKDVTVTRAAPDPTLGDHFVLSANARTLGADVLTAVKGLLGSVPNASGLLGSASTALPDKVIKLDEYVRNGTASAFRFDLTQLLDPAETKAAAGRPLVLAIDLSPTATVTPPSSATPLDISTLSGLLSLAVGGGTARSSASAEATPVG